MRCARDNISVEHTKDYMAGTYVRHCHYWIYIYPSEFIRGNALYPLNLVIESTNRRKSPTKIPITVTSPYMHSQLPRSPEDLLHSNRQNTHQIQGLIYKLKPPLNTIMEEKKTPSQNTADPTEPRGSFSTSPSSTPSTPSCESTEWEQLSTTGTDPSTLSTEFEVLKGYNRIPIYERRAQWLAEQQARREQKLQSSPGGTVHNEPKAFQPNSQLPFPITAQFVRYYGGGNGRPWEQERSPQSDDSQRTVVTSANQFYTPTTNSSYLSTPISSPSSPESTPEISSFTQRRELIERKQGRPSPPSRKTSGIPSFTSLFESKWNWGLPSHSLFPALRKSHL